MGFLVLMTPTLQHVSEIISLFDNSVILANIWNIKYNAIVQIKPQKVWHSTTELFSDFSSKDYGFWETNVERI